MPDPQNTMGDLFNTVNEEGPSIAPPPTAPDPKPAGDPPAPDPAKPAGDPPAGDPPPADPAKPDPAKPEGDPDPDKGEGDDDGDEEGDVWAEVNQLRGRDFTFELPENVEPDTPEAIIHFENAVREEERKNVIEDIKKTDPRLYAYMLHRQQGGTDADFFNPNTVSNLPDINEFKESIDLQKEVYLRSLKAKGIGDDEAQVLVDKAVTDKTLTTKSEAAYNQIKADDDKLATKLEQQALQIEQANQQVASTLLSDVAKLINENSLVFKIPEVDKEPFSTFFQNNVVIDNGKAFITLEIDGKEVKAKEALEQMYMLYKKSDLSKVALNVQTTTRTNRFKAKAAKAGAVGNNTPASDPGKGQPTIQDIFQM